MTMYDLNMIWAESQTEKGVCSIDKSYPKAGVEKYESYMLHAESLRMLWTKYESYILHTSATMYTFQNLDTAVNDNV